MLGNPRPRSRCVTEAGFHDVLEERTTSKTASTSDSTSRLTFRRERRLPAGSSVPSARRIERPRAVSRVSRMGTLWDTVGR